MPGCASRRCGASTTWAGRPGKAASRGAEAACYQDGPGELLQVVQVALLVIVEEIYGGPEPDGEAFLERPARLEGQRVLRQHGYVSMDIR